MEIYNIENLSFRYPNTSENALKNVSFSVSGGEFITICGRSGCGKSTLLRLLKPVISPSGKTDGEVLFKGKDIRSMTLREQSESIGFVTQDPDNQIVTDKVWHELAFGPESLGLSARQIRARVAEMASFFGIQNWFHKKTSDLSGGQKQLLNLASVMVMQPEVIILDEPTSQLDPIAARDFLETLSRINREIGTTVILSEHRLEEVFPLSNRVIVMEEGRVTTNAKPSDAAFWLYKNGAYDAVPSAARIYCAMGGEKTCPVTVREGRKWLERRALTAPPIKKAFIAEEFSDKNRAVAAELKDVWFRYEKNLDDVIRGLSVKVYKNELFAVMGGNGTGKSTMLSVMASIIKPWRGKSDIKGKTSMLPQNPKTLFLRKTVELDLLEALSESKLTKEEKRVRVMRVSELCGLSSLLSRHPYDLSGGEQQKAALAKVLLTEPEILLLDEPTKGMDALFKKQFASILRALKNRGVTVIMVSHDIEFCARCADRCAMFFDGKIISSNTPRAFFSGKTFYTTAANRISRGIVDGAVLCEDVASAFGFETAQETYEEEKPVLPSENETVPEKKPKKITWRKITAGCLFALLFAALTYLTQNGFTLINQQLLEFLQILSAGLCAAYFIPKKDTQGRAPRTPKEERRLTKRTALSVIITLTAVPLTVFTGIFYLGDRKYYFISLMIILETLLPFIIIFEKRKPQARELVVISVLCAIAVAGRAAFFMLPQFKPALAVIIIAGICFGAETGFLTGAVTGFVSNFFFGQSPLTPWQMCAFGIVGFIAGILFKKGLLSKTKMSLCIYGFLSAFVIYGGIMNPAALLVWQNSPTTAMFVSSYAAGIPFDIIHGVSTAFFLWFISEPMIEKLDRVKAKYGLIK